MRILFLHEVGYLEKPIFEMHEFPEHLANNGHDVAFADYPESRSARARSIFGDVVSGRVDSRARIRLYSLGSVSSGIVGRLAAVFVFPIFFFKVLRNFKPDVVVSYAVPTSGWQAAIICRLLGLPLLYRALDVSHKIRKSIFSPFVIFAERIVYSTASWVSCNNPALMQYCLSLGAREEKSSVDYPPLDLKHFQEATFNPGILKKLGVSDESQVILYMGSFFYFSGLDEVLRSLRVFDSRPTLILIGGGEQDAYLRKLVDELSLGQNVKFTGMIDFAELPAYFSIAHVAINPMQPSLVSNMALPNKVLQYMAAGLPVVSTHLDGLSSLFAEEKGVVLVPRSADVLAAARALLHHPDRKNLGRANRTAVSHKFNSNDSVRRFEQRLLELGDPT